MRWLALAGWIAMTGAVAGISGIWTGREVPRWYRTLRRPSFAPPNWVFGPVWSVLYLMMAVAAWMVGESPVSAMRSWALAIFLVQLALNFAWSWIFFHRHAIGAALAEILALWAAIAATIGLFAQVSALAAWLMAPYLAWVSFAAALNAGFWRLNPERD
jgi:tryptophan-rich sensory protein